MSFGGQQFAFGLHAATHEAKRKATTKQRRGPSLNLSTNSITTHRFPLNFKYQQIIHLEIQTQQQWLNEKFSKIPHAENGWVVHSSAVRTIVGPLMSRLLFSQFNCERHRDCVLEPANMMVDGQSKQKLFGQVCFDSWIVMTNFYPKLFLKQAIPILFHWPHRTNIMELNALKRSHYGLPILLPPAFVCLSIAMPAPCALVHVLNETNIADFQV